MSMGPYRFIYQCDPVDHFDGAQRLVGLGDPTAEADLEHALHVLRDTPGSWWEGDIIAGPYCVTVPDPASFQWSIAAWVVKQSNNGTTFVVSRVEMPWLAEHSMRLELTL